MGFLSLFDRGRKRSQRLYDEARELVDAGSFDEALKIGRKLRKLSYSGAFEIEGLAYAGSKRHEDAVRVLREGLTHAPHVWLNWHLLGNCLSDLGRFDEALAAFDRAAACPKVDLSYVNLNRAIVAVRAKDYAAALVRLETVHGDSTRLPAIATRISALRGLQRNEEALQLAEQTLRAWSDAGSVGDMQAVGSIALAYAELRRSRGDNPLAVRATAIDHWRSTYYEDLLWLIRDVVPAYSSSARYFRLIVHGDTFASEDVEADGFFMSLDVVADSVEEALLFAKQLDDFDGAADVRVHEAVDLGSHADGPKGVYAAKGRAYYRETSE